MHETEQRPLRATAARSHADSTRPATSLAETQRGGHEGGAERHPPASVPRGPALSMSGDHTFSSSILLSSDSASVYLEASSPAANASAASTTTAAAAAAATAGAVPPPLWWENSSSLVAEETAVPTSLGHLATSSAVPIDWRCSIDFSHEVESRAEAELQQLWTTLWCATHSEAALQAALAGSRVQWNPYRPARGGPEVREEVLNSEVAEFQEMIPVDSMYLQGTALTRPDHRAIVKHATATTSPHRPPQRIKGSRAKGVDEEVLAVDESGVDLRPPVPPHTAPATAAPVAEAGADARYTEAWWSAHRADAEAALFRYLWEAVVVPFYAERPTSSFPRPFSLLGMPTHEPSASLTLSPSRDKGEKEEKDVSGLVTAFWPTREDKRNWALDSEPRSSSPSFARSSRSEQDEGGGRPRSPLARTQRSGCGPLLHSTQDLVVVSDDSLEVEVLDDKDIIETTPRPEEEREERTHKPSKPVGQQNPDISSPAQAALRTSRRRERPSTAGVHSTVLSSIEDVPLGMPTALSRDGNGTLAARQRARSARTDDAAAAEKDRLPLSSHASQLRAAGRAQRWTATPTLHTTVVETPAEAKMDAPVVKPVSAAQQRPPTARPLGSTANKRVASPQTNTRPGASSSPRGLTSAGATNSGTTTTAGGGGGGRMRAVGSAVETREGTASPPGKRPERGNALRGQGLPGQLNSSANGSANRALRLLELRSRSKSRPPFVQRIPSPGASPAAINSATTATTSGAAATATGDASRARKGQLSLLSEEPADASRQKTSQRHGQLSPMTAVPADGRQRRHAHGSGHVARKDNGATGKAPACLLEEDGLTHTILGRDGSERRMTKARLAPLHETAANSASSQDRLMATNSQRLPSALGRTPSAKLRRQEKRVHRSTSMGSKKAAVQRPTTAHR